MAMSLSSAINNQIEEPEQTMCFKTISENFRHIFNKTTMHVVMNGKIKVPCYEVNSTMSPNQTTAVTTLTSTMPPTTTGVIPGNKSTTDLIEETKKAFSDLFMKFLKMLSEIAKHMSG